MEKGQLLQDFLSLVKVEGFSKRYSKDITGQEYFSIPLEAIVAIEKRLLSPNACCLVYFSMEYGLVSSFYN